MQNVLDLNEYGVTPLQHTEMENTDGGGWQSWAITFVRDYIIGKGVDYVLANLPKGSGPADDSLDGYDSWTHIEN